MLVRARHSPTSSSARRRRQRTYDAMQRKAQAGHVTGGRVFGYDNVEVVDATATVACRAAHQRAGGGRRAADLRALRGWSRADAASPRRSTLRARRRRGRSKDGPPAWVPSTVRDVLLPRAVSRRDGVEPDAEARTTGGSIDSTPARGEWMRRPAPELRIVSDERCGRRPTHDSRVARAVSARHDGQAGAPDSRDATRSTCSSDSRVCGVCGGGLSVRTRGSTAALATSTAALGYHKRGATVCANRYELPMDGHERRGPARDARRAGALDRQLSEAAIALALERLRRRRSDDDERRARCDASSDACDAELRRLTDALARRWARCRAVLTASASAQARREGSPRGSTRLAQVAAHAELDRSARARGVCSARRRLARPAHQNVAAGAPGAPQGAGRAAAVHAGAERRRYAASTGDGTLTNGSGGNCVSNRDGVPRGIRTLVSALKGPRPGPLDDGDVSAGTLRAGAT